MRILVTSALSGQHESRTCCNVSGGGILTILNARLLERSIAIPCGFRPLMKHPHFHSLAGPIDSSLKKEGHALVLDFQGIVQESRLHRVEEGFLHAKQAMTEAGPSTTSAAWAAHGWPALPGYDRGHRVCAHPSRVQRVVPVHVPLDLLNSQAHYPSFYRIESHP